MLSQKVKKYIDEHSFCSEYLFKDWNSFLDILYAEGGRISSILWWDYCKSQNRNFLLEAADIAIQRIRNICMPRLICSKMV